MLSCTTDNHLFPLPQTCLETGLRSAWIAQNTRQNARSGALLCAPQPMLQWWSFNALTTYAVVSNHGEVWILPRLSSLVRRCWLS
jgi:hypothetical protein